MSDATNPLDDLLDDDDTGASLLDGALAAETPPAYTRDEVIKRGHVTWKGEESEAVFEWQEAGNWFGESKTFAEFEEAQAWVDSKFEVPRGTKGYSVPDLAEYD